MLYVGIVITFYRIFINRISLNVFLHMTINFKIYKRSVRYVNDLFFYCNPYISSAKEVFSVIFTSTTTCSFLGLIFLEISQIKNNK